MWDEVDPLGPHEFGLDEFEVIRGVSFAVGVPVDSPIAFKKKVFAAAVTASIGNKSVDHVFKVYGDYWNFSNPDPQTLETLSMIRTMKSHIADGLETISAADHYRSPSLVACWGALFRLQSTFFAASLTIRQGYNFESAALLRMALEQLAWIYVIHSKNPNEDHFRIRPSKCIGSLRGMFPGVGRLYGS